MTTKIKLSTTVVVLCCIVFLVTAQRVSAQSPDKVAQAMVKGLRDEHCEQCRDLQSMYTTELKVGDRGTAYQDSLKQAENIVISNVKNFLDNSGKLKLKINIHSNFMSKKPLTPEKVSVYLTRFRTIDNTTVEKWCSYLGRFSGTVSPHLVYGLIAFKDFLFEGGQWKKGNPDRVLVRLASLDKNALYRWETAIGRSKTLYAEVSSGLWVLLAIDGLFVNDSFELSVFDAAFPIAEKLLNN
jgi:hypothetical protein